MAQQLQIALSFLGHKLRANISTEKFSEKIMQKEREEYL